MLCAMEIKAVMYLYSLLLACERYVKYEGESNENLRYFLSRNLLNT